MDNNNQFNQPTSPTVSTPQPQAQPVPQAAPQLATTDTPKKSSPSKIIIIIIAIFALIVLIPIIFAIIVFFSNASEPLDNSLSLRETLEANGLVTEPDDEHPIKRPGNYTDNGEHFNIYAKTTSDCAQAGSIVNNY